MQNVIFELLLEAARSKFAPTEVSRLNCVFACETREALSNYISSYKAGAVLGSNTGKPLFFYEIRPMQSCKVTKKDFMSLCGIAYLEAGANTAIDAVNHYWKTNPYPESTEVLIPVDCEVVSAGIAKIDASLLKLTNLY